MFNVFTVMHSFAGIAYWGIGVTDEVMNDIIRPGAAATQKYLSGSSAASGCPGSRSGIIVSSVLPADKCSRQMQML
jgi:hypothetical protein